MTERRAAIVTGSNRGIGAAIATALAKKDMDICLNGPNEECTQEAQALAAELEATLGVRAIAVQADISKFDEAQRLIDCALEAFGRVDVLVNNAGITRDGLIARMSEADFDSVIAINLKGTFNCCKAAARPMMKQHYGRIVNMSSIVGVHGNAGQVNYAASKAGVIGITKSLALELASRNISVNAIAPGFIDTAMTQKLSEAQRAALSERIGMKRLGSVDDVANLAAFLASEESGYITGQVIGVDGGMF